MINYNGKVFKPVSNSSNAETTNETVFVYQQKENIITCTYSGGNIIEGHLIGIVDLAGNIDMRYHQVNLKHEIMTGTCQSTPEILETGKIRLYEKWQWTSGDHSKGSSILEEQ